MKKVMMIAAFAADRHWYPANQKEPRTMMLLPWTKG